MSDNVTRFTITKDLDNTFVFTIKADGSTLPMEITEPDGNGAGGDTFEAKLINLETETVSLTKTLTVTNALSGKVNLLITAAESGNLENGRGSKADRYYLQPMYKLVIACNTTNNGNFIARVPEIYVD